SSRKQERRRRDERAERRAIQVLVGIFVGLGGLALVAVNVLLDDPPPSAPAVAQTPSEGAPKAPVAEPPPPPNVLSAPAVERVDLPALRYLRNEGLTIAAEGLPAVDSPSEGASVGRWAAQETCRFAYGVWEFSPNRRFRFLPTCPSMEGQVLFGAYSVEGGTIRMSPLRVGEVELVSEFQVEKPSRLLTRVNVSGKQVTLSVRQRVTVIRSGLFGDAFFDTYAVKNTLSVQRTPRQRPPPVTAPPKSPPSKRDPLLELLRGQNK
ncbi:MAG: hypothetical protein AAFV29_08415, partial [Myxococcota bacterium]